MNFYNQYLQGIQKKKKKKRIQHPSPSTQGMHLDEKCRTAELVTTVTVTGSTVSVISSTTQFLSPTSGLLTWRNVFVIDRHSALLRLCELNFVMNMLSWIPWQHVWLYRISSIFTQMLHLRLPKKKKSFLVEAVWALPTASLLWWWHYSTESLLKNHLALLPVRSMKEEISSPHQRAGCAWTSCCLMATKIIELLLKLAI